MALKRMTDARLQDLKRAMLQDERDLDAYWNPAWRCYEEAYTSRVHDRPTINGKDYKVNTALPAVEALVASSTARGLRHTFTARSADHVTNAALAEGLVAAQLERMNGERIHEDANRNSKKFGMGWLKLGWNLEGVLRDYHSVVDKKSQEEITQLRD